VPLGHVLASTSRLMKSSCSSPRHAAPCVRREPSYRERVRGADPGASRSSRSAPLGMRTNSEVGVGCGYAPLVRSARRRADSSRRSSAAFSASRQPSPTWLSKSRFSAESRIPRPSSLCLAQCRPICERDVATDLPFLSDGPSSIGVQCRSVAMMATPSGADFLRFEGVPSEPLGSPVSAPSRSASRP